MTLIVIFLPFSYFSAVFVVYMFSEAVIKRYAKGATHIYDEIKVKHYGTIKGAVKGILGGRSSYYRSMNGTKLISEEEQKRIAAVFRKYGYDTDNLFDEYILSY